MTLFDLLWDWRTLMALSVVDAFLVVMFFAWDAKHLALLTRRCNLAHELPQATQLRTGARDRDAFNREV